MNQEVGGVALIQQIDSNTIVAFAGSITPHLFKVDVHTGALLGSIYDYIPHQQKVDFFSGYGLHKDGYIYTAPTTNLRNASFRNSLYMIKLDTSDLKILWMKQVRMPDTIADKRVLTTAMFNAPDNKIYVLGYYLDTTKIFIMTIDTAANILAISYPFDQLPLNVEKPSIHKYFGEMTPDRTQFLLLVSNLSYTHRNIIAVIDTSMQLRKYHSYPQALNFIQTSDGNYAICGRNDLIHKLDTNFQIIQTIRSPWEGTWYTYVKEAKDGGLYITGSANIQATEGDMGFIKAEPHGGINSVQEVQDITTQITLSPNPATTQVHIESPIKIERYILNNTSGTSVQSGALDAENNIDISQLPQGIYFLQLQLVNGQRVVKKLVRSF